MISPRANARRDVRIEVGTARAIPSEMVSVAIGPEVRVVEGSLKPSDIALLRQWIDINRAAIVSYWHGDIESTKEALAAIQPLK